jgi:hypothetical protein
MPLTTDIDPSKIIINFGGINISGYADGTYALLERNEDLWNSVTGADGFTTRVKTNNFAGLLTLTLMQSSPSNSLLMAFYLLDETEGKGVLPMSFKNLNSSELAFAPAAWIRKVPNLEHGKELTNREWAIAMSDLTIFAGGNELFQG